MNTTDTEAPAVPRGWPPEQPVEVVRVSRFLFRLSVGMAVVFVGAAGYAICLLWRISEAVTSLAAR